MAVTLTVLRLGLPSAVARAFRSQHAVVDIRICPDHGRNVKRLRDEQMVLRWCAAGMVEASRQFRRVNGLTSIYPPSAPRAAACCYRIVRTDGNAEEVNAADAHRAATEVPPRRD